MSTTDTQVSELIINTLTKAQYDTLVNNNQVSNTELYLTKDEEYLLSVSVIYGTTTYAQITAMLTDKEVPVCDYNGYRYTYVGLDTYYYFTCVINDTIKYIRVNSSNSWSNGSYQVQQLISDLGTIRSNASSAYATTQNLATVATTGSYTDLSNTPIIPAITDTYLATSTDGMSGKAVASAISTKQDNLSSQTAYSAKGTSSKVPQITTNNLGQVTAITEVNISYPDQLPTQTGNNGKFLTTNGSTVSWATVQSSGGTVTSVQVQATSPVQSSTSTAQSTTLNTTISLADAYGDTKNPYGSKTKNYVLAAPTTAAGTPSFRALDKSDIPLASETAVSGGTNISLVTTGEKYTWNSKQDALSTQTAYTSKGSATKVPQITTNTLGQVTGITEVTITQPTVNNKTITIQKNSTTVDSFTLNQSSDKTINITVPTSASDVGAVAANNTITGATKCKITYDSKGLVTAGADLSASDIPDLSSTYLTSHQSIKTLNTDNTTAQSANSSEAIAGSGSINLHKVSKTGSYSDLNNKPTIPTVNNNTITIQKNSSTVDSFTLNQSSDKTINIEVPTDAGSINGITKLYNGWFQNAIENSVQFGDGLNKGYFTAFNLLHGVQNLFYLANKGLATGTAATISCNYYDPYGYDFVNGEYARYDDSINPSTAFSSTPFVWEIKCSTAFEWTDVTRFFMVGHRIYSSFNVTKYKIEVAYAYSSGTYTWGTVVDYDGDSVDITRKYYSLVSSASGQSYHQIYGVRLTISESSETVFTLAEFMLLGSRGYEKKSASMNALDLGGGTVVGNITIPTSYGSFVGNLNGNATTASSATSATKATQLSEQDTRNTNENPSYYMSNYPYSIVSEFKVLSTIGISTTGWFGQLQTYVQWNDSSGGYPTQIAIDPADNKVYRRVATGNSTWSAWKEMADYPTQVEISTASVSVALAANTDYYFTNAAITDITFSSCANSYLETTIEFDTGSTAPTLTDSANITWVAGSAPTLNANKHYVIVIYNKQGFVKEY